LKIKEIICVITLFIVTEVNAASFNCEQELTRVETIICNNDWLSALDEELELSYSSALTKVTDKLYLKKQQRDWLKARNQIKHKWDLGSAYKHRLSQLKQFELPTPENISQHRKEFKTIKGYKLEIRETGDTFVFRESDYKITEFHPETFTFSTLYESKHKVEYVAHNDKYIVLTNMTYSSKKPLIVIERNTGKEVIRKNLKDRVQWGVIDNNKLLGVQYDELIIFDLKTLKIKKTLKNENSYRVVNAVKKDNKIIIHTPHFIDIYDLSFKRLRRIRGVYDKDKMLVHGDFVVISGYSKTVNVYDLKTGVLVKKFEKPSSLVSYSISNGKIWIFPRTERSDNAVVYNFSTEEKLHTFNMVSDYQFWSDKNLIFLNVFERMLGYTTFTQATLAN